MRRRHIGCCLRGGSKDVGVIGHGKGGKYIPAKMARLAKCKIAGVSDDSAPRHLISRPLKLVMARSSTNVDVTYYREFLMYRISTPHRLKVSYRLLVSYELLRSHDVRSRT